MTKHSSFSLETPHGARLHGVVNLPKIEGCRPTVVISHGFKGFLEWGFFPYLADLLAARGFTTVRFNYSGSGMLPGDELVTDLDAFGNATFSRDLEELLVVLAALDEQIAPGRIDTDRVGLLGHSRGGGISLLASAHPEWRSRLRALATWSAVETFDRLPEEHKEIWRAEGELRIQNARTGQDLPLRRSILDDLETHRQELDLLTAAGTRTVPWMIVHGSDDETVPVAEAHQLAEAAEGVTRLDVIGGANHTFGARHPFAGPTPYLVRALNLTQDWFRRYLAPAPRGQ